MTVLSKNDYYQSDGIQQDRLFSAHRRYDGSRPVQHRARSVSPFASGGFWADILKLAVLLTLILSVVVLSFDVGALFSGRTKIGSLSAQIESLNSSNALLHEDLLLAMNHPVLRESNADEEETVITLTAALP